MNNDEFQIESLLGRYKLREVPVGLKYRIFRPQRKRWKQSWTAIAASISIVVAVGLLWQFPSKPVQQQEIVAATADETLSLADIENSIRRAGQAGQLLALADIVEENSDREEARKLYEVVAHSYSDLNAGQQAKIRLESF